MLRLDLAQANYEYLGNSNMDLESKEEVAHRLTLISNNSNLVYQTEALSKEQVKTLFHKLQQSHYGTYKGSRVGDMSIHSEGKLSVGSPVAKLRKRISKELFPTSQFQLN